MLPLAGPDFPASPEQLAAALRAGLEARAIAPREVRVRGGAFPQIDELTVDLTAAALTRATRLPLASGAAGEGIEVAQLAITATPLAFEGTPLCIAIQAQAAALGFARDAAQQPLLVLTRAAGGTVSIEAKRTDLELLLKALAADAAAKQGAEIKTARLEFTTRGPRALDFRAEVTAKVFIMTAALAVTGQIEVDDQLNLRVHHLAVTGDGMVANLAASQLRPRFDELEKRTIPLAAHSFAGVKLHDVRLGGGDTLSLEAQFGS